MGNPKDREFTAVVGTEKTSAATLRTAEGEAKFSWSRATGALEVNVVVPNGMQARLHVLVEEGSVHKDGMKMKVEEVAEHQKKFNLMVLGAGSHRFSTAGVA